jgi:serine/threonine-protein phosphatase 5
MSRGNHETNDMNRVYGFEGEIKQKYTDMMFRLFTEVFCAIPLCHVIEKRIFVVHGGLFSRDDVKLDELKKIDRFRQPGQEGKQTLFAWMFLCCSHI